MAKGRRTAQLAGLAALGALGYMLSKDRKGEGAPVETRTFSPVEPQKQADIGDDRDIGGGVHPGGFRRNMETGEMYDPGTVATRAPASVAAPASVRAPAVRTGTDSRAGGVGMENYVPRRRPEAPAAVSTNSRAGGVGMENYVPRRRPEAPAAAYNPPPMSPEMRQQAEAQALERVSPEEYLIGGPGLKGVAALAKGLANRTGARAAESAAPYLKELPGPAGRAALPAPTPRLTGPSATQMRESARGARATARQEEMLRENASRYGLDPNAPGYEAAMRALRENIGGRDFTVKKKGGAIKAKPAAKKMASGGSTSSASKRGDGIASRGKTKCKMY
jgi:hypothetical protein